MVFPEPYVKSWSDPGDKAEWDLLLVADKHFFNVNSVAWFLEDVVSKDERLQKMRIGIVGQVGQILEKAWSRKLPNVKWLGFVHDLDATRALSRIAVCPDRGGTGVSVKMLSALAAGQPLVATSTAFRGLPADIVNGAPICDDAQAMIVDLNALVGDRDKLRARSESARQTYAMLKYAGSYATAMEMARDRAGAAARQALIAEFTKDEAPAPPSRPATVGAVLPLGFEIGGAATPLLGPGWHNGERWGRWTDGASALLTFPRAWLAGAVEIEVRLVDSKRPNPVAIFCDGRQVTPANLSTRHRAAYLRVDPEMTSGGEMVTIEFRAGSEFCPKDCQGSADERVLGLGLRSFSIAFSQQARWKLRLKQAVIGPFGRRR
jgi:hypothetical protein